MKNLNSFLILLFLIVTSSCDPGKDKEWSELPEVTKLEELKQTDFVLTLENPVLENKNIIYAPSFLFAWEIMQDALGSKVIPGNNNSADLTLLTKSTSYENSLRDNEYVGYVTTENDEVIVRSFFNKTLPFENKMHVRDEPILFEKTKVTAFGMNSSHEEIAKSAEVIYYNNDDNFILKLVPKDKDHEIILVKGLNNYKTLADAVKETYTVIEKGKEEKKDAGQLWKYGIAAEDMFAIPAIKFNIGTNYKTLEGQKFLTADNKPHIINEAYQRTGFILNENGAVVESEVMIAVDSVGVEPEVKRPKKMIFDKSFLIIIKRVDQTNPYFVMKVENAELMEKK